jgi:hypothetical protein
VKQWVRCAVAKKKEEEEEALRREESAADAHAAAVCVALGSSDGITSQTGRHSRKKNFSGLNFR